MKGIDSVPAEDRIRVVRLIENLSWGLGSILHSAAHGGGSGQACKLLLQEFSQSAPHREEARKSAMRLCGIGVASSGIYPGSGGPHCERVGRNRKDSD